MYPAPFRYHRAASVDAAIRQLSELGEGARALAGGQSLLVWLKMRFGEVSDLVDIGRIPGLDTITQDAAGVRIGALATHARIARSPLAKLLLSIASILLAVGVVLFQGIAEEPICFSSKGSSSSRREARRRTSTANLAADWATPARTCSTRKSSWRG